MLNLFYAVIINRYFFVIVIYRYNQFKFKYSRKMVYKKCCKNNKKI